MKSEIYIGLKLFFFISGFLISSFISAQISGEISDEETKEPLAFVNIVYNEKSHGVTTNIDGKFIIPTNAKVQFLKISYVGYELKEIPFEKLSGKKTVFITLKKKTIDLNEVTVLPGENPAHRIIKKVIENRDKNNPEKMTSFSYTSYNKMIFTFNIDDLKPRDTIGSLLDSVKASKDTTRKNKPDSSYIRAKKFLDSQHIMITESVSERKFIFPDKNSEKVLATRISGLQNPSFAMLATQMQSFSFYNELITLYEKVYLNPISKGSPKKYFFQIEDTTFSEKGDTVFVISFRPYKGKNFQGLKGILNINTNGYAIESVKAEPYELSGMVDIRVQQKYEFIDGKQWFPVQLNTDLTFTNIAGQAGKKTMKMIGIGKSYLQDISLNPELNKKEFNSVELSMETEAAAKGEEILKKYRVDSLTAKDRKTYHVIDSIGKKEKLDLKVKLMESFARGAIPWGFVDIDFTKLLQYNEYEGFRIGLGLSTNEKVTKWASLGGFYAASSADKAMKYGGHLQFNLSKDNEVALKASYSQDVLESDGYRFAEDVNLRQSDFYRDFLVAEMDSVEKMDAQFSFRAFQYLKAYFSLSRNYLNVTNHFRYGVSETRADLLDNFVFTEASVKIKYAYNEKFIKFPYGKFSLGTNYPVLWLNFTQGLNLLDGKHEYSKIEAKVGKMFLTKTFGKTFCSLAGGYLFGNVPYTAYYNGRASYNKFSLEAFNSFATMRMNEFISDRFISFFFKQDFGTLLFKTKKFKPEIAFVHNIGFADFKSSNSYFDKPVQTY
ncbi:MAG: hypothetical protein A2491_13775, partial [Bacteroidetes bacterium RIFOXYC12_FULL_35_7]